MKIIRLTKRDVGFDSKEACEHYFKNTLPANDYVFDIRGTKPQVTPDADEAHQLLLFTYDNEIVALASLDEKLYSDVRNTNGTYRVNGLKLKSETLKTFGTTITLTQLQAYLNTVHYDKKVWQAGKPVQGWNNLPVELDAKILAFLKDVEWQHFI